MAIVVVGNVFVDIKGYPDDAFVAGGKVSGRVETMHGGVARNVAEDIANVELRPRFVSTVDESGEGKAVIDKLNDHKVDTSFLIPASDGMGIWLAIFDNSGDVIASISKRPSMGALTELIRTKGDEIFTGADSVVVEIDMDKDIIKQVFSLAEKYSVPVYGVVANMAIASKRRDFITQTDCFICNAQEAGILFVEDYSSMSPEELCDIMADKVKSAGIPSIVVTMGSQGSVYACSNGEKGICPAKKVNVRDTTGAGDAFCSGVAIGLTYGKTMSEALEIGTKLAASVICINENSCPRFRPSEFGIDFKED